MVASHAPKLFDRGRSHRTSHQSRSGLGTSLAKDRYHPRLSTWLIYTKRHIPSVVWSLRELAHSQRSENHPRAVARFRLSPAAAVLPRADVPLDRDRLGLLASEPTAVRSRINVRMPGFHRGAESGHSSIVKRTIETVVAIAKRPLYRTARRTTEKCTGTIRHDATAGRPQEKAAPR
jgi:hypothetical protein